MRILLFALMLSVMGCASMGPSHSGVPKAINLEFKGKPGETTNTRYYSNARIMSFEDAQLVRDHSEAVDFMVASHVTDFSPADKILKVTVKTVQKDGIVELHDLAFPELNEEIHYVLRTNGEVLRAGRFPPQSLFYVPSLPVPKHAVEVGDTWTMEHTWYSSKDGIPLRLEVVAILKDIVRCEKTGVCADIEISGHVGLVMAPTTIGSRFESRIWGRVLFSLERGDVLWSEMRSEENIGAKNDRMAVRSCMVSEMKRSTPYKIQFACDPKDEVVGRTPVFR